MNFLSSLSQVSLLDCIVAFPHFLGFMANNFHGCSGIYPCPSEVRGGTVAEVMKPEVNDACIHEGSLEGAADPLKRSAFIREDVPGGKTARPSKSLERHFHIRGHGNLASGLGLGVQGAEGDKSSLHVNAVPRQADNFTEALS